MEPVAGVGPGWSATPLCSEPGQPAAPPAVPVTAVPELSGIGGGAVPRSPHGFLAEELPRIAPEPPGGHRPLHLPWERPLRQAGCPASPQLGEPCCRSGSQDADVGTGLWSGAGGGRRRRGVASQLTPRGPWGCRGPSESCRVEAERPEATGERAWPWERQVSLAEASSWARFRCELSRDAPGISLNGRAWGHGATPAPIHLLCRTGLPWL